MERTLPAYPLFVKDPYFSFWAQTEVLNERDVIFWTGAEKKLYGYIKVDGEPYCFLGDAPRGIKRAEQTGLTVTAFTTDYTFKAGKAELKVSFVSPLAPDDLRTLSCPVCYMNYEVRGAAKNVEVILVADQCICYNGARDRVRGGAVKASGFETAFFGLKRQLALSVDSDRFGADWGYWYLAGERAYYTSAESCENYLLSGAKPAAGKFESAKVLIASCSAKRGKIMLGFDDTASVNYFGDVLKGYYFDGGRTIFDALEEVYATSSEIDKHLAAFDKALRARAEVYGKEYIKVLYASLRQSVAAHKLVKDRSGNVLFLSKECYSNGCMATVDVSYPSVPLYLLYEPELVRGMLRPIFRFAAMPVWKYDFAPHDAGTYPNCCGQVYGMRAENDEWLADMHDTRENETRFPYWQLPETAELYDLKYQMPVEECANMLIMLAAAYKADGKLDMVRDEIGMLEKWNDYLVRYGLKPGYQLCTDDFSGHLANNLNLAIKATVGIACFAELCGALGGERSACAEKYRKLAEDYARQIVECYASSDHTPLTWESGEETYGLKYNLAFDKVLGLGLFPQEFAERDVAYCLKKSNKYGIPLDHRADFTKSDWLVWTACLTDDVESSKKLISGIDAYLRESGDRLPFGDWYDTKTGRSMGFRNRTVQGGCFMLLLRGAFEK